ncbi:MAG: Hpt domain-containing protein [Lachnospiraceae bacterium]|nr:Hpt domain-containing protein [Lachnospiraceae bacterium]
MEGFDFLDQEVGLEYCAQDEEIYREIIEGYLDEDRREELAKYYEAEDLANYRVVAHAIKSTSLTIGATDLSEKAKSLEYAAADGDMAFIKEHNDELVALYTDILDKIKAAL